MSAPTLRRLFQPARIGPLALRNRIVMAPMGTMFGDAAGNVTPRTIAYYAARAAGGAGMVIVEATLVEPSGQIIPNQLRIDDDRFVPGLSALASAIKERGAAAVVQLHHGGREAKSRLSGVPVVGPSPLPGRSGEKPSELTVEGIHVLVERFSEAAQRARYAGFEGVELHGAHGYIFAQFLTSAFNQRRDAYGGILENRARLLLETISAIRLRLGRGFPVWSRINARHYNLPGGITLDESTRVARWLEQAGADAVNVSCYGAGTQNFVNCPEEHGALAHLAGAVKQEVGVPVIAVGYIDVQTGEEVLARGDADLVAVGRGFLADPEWPSKAAAGRVDLVCPCIACMRCLGDMLFKGMELHCSVNPMLGRELETVVAPAERRKRVVVVGGGPGGMEAAWVAARRGHHVTLLEKDAEVGGQLRQAERPPGKERLRGLATYLAASMADAGVEVKKGTEATLEAVLELAPDAVVLATGAVPAWPDIAGLEKAPVASAEDVLSGLAVVGERVVVIGGELVGCETADFLAHRGKKVTVVRRGPAFLTGKIPFLREAFLEKLEKEGVTLLAGVEYERAAAEGLYVKVAGSPRLLEADTIVVAAGVSPNRRLAEQLQGKLREVHLVGDCVEPRQILEAVHEGFRAGVSL